MPSLRGKLDALRPTLALAAQSVLDEWQLGEDGMDPVLGAGGACDEIADAMRDVVYDKLGDVEILEGGHDGDDHAWLIVVDDREAVGLDIPPSVYETGGGYSWKKIEGAEVSPLDVLLFDLDRSDVVDRLGTIASKVAESVTGEHVHRTAYEGDDFRLSPGIGFHLQPDGRWEPEKVPDHVVENARFSGYLTIQGYKCVVFELDGEQWAQKSTGTVASKLAKRVASRVVALGKPDSRDAPKQNVYPNMNMQDLLYELSAIFGPAWNGEVEAGMMKLGEEKVAQLLRKLGGPR